MVRPRVPDSHRRFKFHVYRSLIRGRPAVYEMTVLDVYGHRTLYYSNSFPPAVFDVIPHYSLKSVSVCYSHRQPNGGKQVAAPLMSEKNFHSTFYAKQ